MRAFLFVAVCFVLVSCFDQGDCLFTNTNYLRVNIMDAKAPTKARIVEFDSVMIADRFVYFPDSLATVLNMAVDPRATETRFVFIYETLVDTLVVTRSDTLVVGYTTQTIVLSPDCGSYNYIKDLEVKYSTFGTGRVIITNPLLLTSVQSNIEILL